MTSTSLENSPERWRRRPSRARYVVSYLLTASSVVLSAGIISNIDTDKGSSDPMTLNTDSPEQLPCVEPVTTPITDFNQQIIDDSITADGFYSDLHEQDPSLERMKPILDHLTLRNVLVNPVADSTQLPPAMASSSYEPLGQEVQDVDPSDIVRALGYFPKEVIDLLNPNISYVRAIDSDPDNPNLGGASGTFNGIIDGISLIALVKGSTSSVIVHEVYHALHKLVCGEGSRFQYTVTELQKSGDIVAYLNDPRIVPASWVDDISQYRQFADNYGAQNYLENWATMLTDLVMDRGMVLEGDDDWGSPYQRVQYAIIADIEARFPGFRDAIELRTKYLRIKPGSAYNTYLADQYAYDTMFSGIPNEIITESVVSAQLISALDGMPGLQYAQGLSVIVGDPDGVDTLYPVQIDNPMIVTDIFTGGPVFVLPLVGSNLDDPFDLVQNVNILPYDPNTMTLVTGYNYQLTQFQQGQSFAYTNDGFFVDGQAISSITMGKHNPTTILSNFAKLFDTQEVMTPIDFARAINP